MKMTHEEKLQFLDDAIELGVRFFDTAQLYNYTPGGNNEKLLGEALSKHSREKFIISTKTGIDEKFQFNNSADLIRKSVEESLANLGTT